MKKIVFCFSVVFLIFLNACDKLPFDQLSSHQHNLVYREKKESTCTADGNVEYWHCSGCNKAFTDESATSEIVNVSIKASHNLASVHSKQPNCEETGNIAHYICTNCDKLFADGNAQNEINASDTVLEKVHTLCALKHDADFHWYECNCGFLKGEKSDHSGGSATCIKGASCVLCNEIYTDIDPSKHNYSSATYKFNSDYSQCTATCICEYSDTHVISETVTTLKDGFIYTATFLNSIFESQKHVMITADMLEPDDSLVKVSELHFSSNENDIFGKMYLPKEFREKYPVIIMCHGYNNNSTNARFVANAKVFAAAGYAVYAFDFCGGSEHSRSQGSTLEMSVLTESQDLNNVIDGIKQLNYIDADNIFLLGQSQGGYVASYVAAQRCNEIKGLILFWPALMLGGENWHNKWSGGRPEGTYDHNGMDVSEKYFNDAMSVDMYEHIKGYTKSVLICHGTADKTVDIKYSQKAVETWGANKATLKIFDGAGHGLNGEQLLEARKYVIEYLILNCL